MKCEVCDGRIQLVITGGIKIAVINSYRICIFIPSLQAVFAAALVAKLPANITNTVPEITQCWILCGCNKRNK